MAVRKGPVSSPALAYSWAGAYIGGHVAHVRPFIQETSEGFTQSPTYITHGGGQLGYNWQSGKIVFGIEADISAGKSRNIFSDQYIDVNLTGSIRGRLGLAFDRILLYATGGVGFVRIFGQSSNLSTAPAKKTLVRPVAGAGIEYALDRNWTIGAEYLRYFGNKNLERARDANGDQFGPGFDDATWVRDVETVRLKLNYRF